MFVAFVSFDPFIQKSLKRSKTSKAFNLEILKFIDELNFYVFKHRHFILIVFSVRKTSRLLQRKRIFEVYFTIDL